MQPICRYCEFEGDPNHPCFGEKEKAQIDRRIQERIEVEQSLAAEVDAAVGAETARCAQIAEFKFSDERTRGPFVECCRQIAAAIRLSKLEKESRDGQ